MGSHNAKARPCRSRRSVGVDKCKALRRRCPSTVHCAALRRLVATLPCSCAMCALAAHPSVTRVCQATQEKLNGHDQLESSFSSPSRRKPNADDSERHYMFQTVPSAADCVHAGRLSKLCAGGRQDWQSRDAYLTEEFLALTTVSETNPRDCIQLVEIASIRSLDTLDTSVCSHMHTHTHTHKSVRARTHTPTQLCACIQTQEFNSTQPHQHTNAQAGDRQEGKGWRGVEKAHVHIWLSPKRGQNGQPGGEGRKCFRNFDIGIFCNGRPKIHTRMRGQ